MAESNPQDKKQRLGDVPPQLPPHPMKGRGDGSCLIRLLDVVCSGRNYICSMKQQSVSQRVSASAAALPLVRLLTAQHLSLCDSSRRMEAVHLDQYVDTSSVRR